MINFIKIATLILLVYIMYIGMCLLIGGIFASIGLSVNYLILTLVGMFVATVIVLSVWMQYRKKDEKIDL